MDLLQIRYVITITECGSMTKAAQQLHVSQSALSLSCKRLEEELGTKIFQRQGRKLELTEAGMHFCEQGREILKMASSLELEMAKFNDSKVHSVTYTSELGDFSTEMQKLYRSFLPNIQLTELRDNAQLTLEQLSNGIAAFAVTAHDHTDEQLVSRLLYEEPMYLFVKDDSPLAEYDIVSMRQLDGVGLITQRHDYSIAEVMMGFYSQAGIKPGSRYYVSDPESMFLSVHGGFGVTFIPESIVNLWKIAPIEMAPGTKKIPMAEGFCKRRIYLTYLRQERNPENVKHFMKFIVHYAELMKTLRNIPNPIQMDEYLQENWPEFAAVLGAGPKPDYENMMSPRQW